MSTTPHSQGSSLFINREGKKQSRANLSWLVMREWRANMREWQLVKDRLVLLEAEKEASLQEQERTLQAEVEQLKLTAQLCAAANRESTAVIGSLLRSAEGAVRIAGR